MVAKIIVLLFVVAILYCLGSGLVYLVRNKQHASQVVTALTWRIALSVTLFLLLFLAFALGWLHPHGI